MMHNGVLPGVLQGVFNGLRAMRQFIHQALRNLHLLIQRVMELVVHAHIILGAGFQTWNGQTEKQLRQSPSFGYIGNYFGLSPGVKRVFTWQSLSVRSPVYIYIYIICLWLFMIHQPTSWPTSTLKNTWATSHYGANMCKPTIPFGVAKPTPFCPAPVYRLELSRPITTKNLTWLPHVLCSSDLAEWWLFGAFSELDTSARCCRSSLDNGMSRPLWLTASRCMLWWALCAHSWVVCMAPVSNLRALKIWAKKAVATGSLQH